MNLSAWVRAGTASASEVLTDEAVGLAAGVVISVFALRARAVDIPTAALDVASTGGGLVPFTT